MKFIITMASHWGDDRPCEEAKAETYTKTQQRLSQYVTEEWRNGGSNHREENGMALREIRLVRWVVNITSLKQLVEFQKKYGRLILEDNNGLRIYDDYIE